MSVIIAVILILMFTLIFVTFIPLQVKFIYNRENKKDIFKMNVNAVWGLIKFNISEPDLVFKNAILAPVIKIKAKVGHPQSDNQIKETEDITYKFTLDELNKIRIRMREFVKHYDNAIRYLLGSTKVSDIVWVTRYGFEDPAYTSMAYGVIWGVKSVIFNYLQGKAKVVDRPKLVVNPNFFRKGFSTRISCIFALRIGHIITAGLKVFVRWIFKRG